MATYRTCVADAKTQKQELEDTKVTALRQIQEVIRQSDQTIKSVCDRRWVGWTWSGGDNERDLVYLLNGRGIMWAGQGQGLVWHGDSSGIEQWIDGAGQDKILSQQQRSQGGIGLVCYKLDKAAGSQQG